MIRDDKRIRLFVGHYGSGKSEVSINYVTRLREQVEGEVALADLDVVNVYFRSRDKKDLIRLMKEWCCERKNPDVKNYEIIMEL